MGCVCVHMLCISFYVTTITDWLVGYMLYLSVFKKNVINRKFSLADYKLLKMLLLLLHFAKKHYAISIKTGYIPYWRIKIHTSYFFTRSYSYSYLTFSLPFLRYLCCCNVFIIFVVVVSSIHFSAFLSNSFLFLLNIYFYFLLINSHFAQITQNLHKQFF